MILADASNSTVRERLPPLQKNTTWTRLVYFEEYASLLEARAREHTLKRWRREWKFALIESTNPDWRDLARDLAML